MQASPLLAGRLVRLEELVKRGHGAEATLGLGSPGAQGRDGAFNGIGGAKVLPVPGREVVEAARHVAPRLGAPEPTFPR